jgi:heme/copper-type cytochrome/quinol oxidase subunit 1
MNESGWRAWAFTRDHERIALLYLATLTVTFLLGGVCALLMRLELAAPGQQIMDRDAYSRVLTVHGALMVFGFLIPCIPSSFGNLLVPRQIGAREVALPRLSLLSLYLLVLAILLSVVSTEPYGFYLAALSYALTSANLIATVHTKRTVDRLPSFVWVMYITSALQLCALLASAARMLRSGSAPLRELSAYAPIAVQLMVLPGAGLTYELYRSGRAKRWAHSALALFTLGELIGLWLATFPAHSHIHDTYVVIANFHFVMVGGTVMAFLGGLHAWWQTLTGRSYHERSANMGWLVVLLGFVICFFAQLLLGLQGMPRRYVDYLPRFANLHLTSSIGALIIAIGLGVLLTTFLRSVRSPPQDAHPQS